LVIDNLHLVTLDAGDCGQRHVATIFERKARTVQRTINGAIIVVNISIMQFGVRMCTNIADCVYRTTHIKQPDGSTVVLDRFGGTGWQIGERSHNFEC